MKLLNLLDALLNLILIEDIKEEAIGDLWEVNYRLVSQRKPWLIRTFLILEMALQLVYASLKISLMNNNQPKNVLKEPFWFSPVLKTSNSDSLTISLIVTCSVFVLILFSFNKTENNLNCTSIKCESLEFLQKSP